MRKCSNDEKKIMVTTVSLLDLLRDKLGSDYKSAKALGINTQRIYKLRHHGGVLTDEQGLKAAEILNFPQELIILSLAAERSLNGPAFGILTHLANQYDHRKVVALALFLLCPLAAVFNYLPTAVA